MREVFGSEVISDEPTVSGIVDRSGNQVLWRQTRTLTLADGTVAYGCAHCAYVSRNPNSIRPHLSAHNVRRTGRKASDELSLNDVLTRLASVDELAADRDRWKSRATKAEGALKSLRKALGVTP